MPSARTEVNKIVNNSRRMLLGQLILPHIDKFKMIHVSHQPEVNRELFFYLLETDEDDLGLNGSPIGANSNLSISDQSASLAGSTMVPSSRDRPKNSFIFNREAFMKDPRVLTAEEDEIWTDLSQLVKVERRHSLAHLYNDNNDSEEDEGEYEMKPANSKSMDADAAASALEVPTLIAAETIKALDLIIIAVSSSVSPIISRTQATLILKKLKDFPDEDELNRNKFVLLVRQWSASTPELANIDIEQLSLYIFPEAEIEIYLLRRLIRAVTQPSEHHSYIQEFSRSTLEQLADFREIVVFVPFLTLFLAIVLSGKFVTPRTYYGANAVTVINNNVYSYSFNQLTPDMSANAGTTITLADASSTADVYAYLLNGLGNALWPASGIAGSTTIGALVPVGALKIRSLRVATDTATSRAVTYIGSSTTQQYQGYNGNANQSFIGMDTSSYAKYVLSPWDGNRYGSCSDLNGSDSVLGNSHYYECGGHAVVIPFNTTQAQFQTIIRGLISGGWIHASTRALITSFMLFHPISTMLVSSDAIIEFRAGGSLSVTHKSNPFAFYTFTSNSPSVSAFYYIFFVYLFFLIVRTLYLHFYLPLTSDSMQFKMWHVADLVNYAVFLVSVISRIIWIVGGRPTDPVWQLDHYPHKYEQTDTLFNLIVTYDSFNVIVSVLGLVRFAKYVPGVGIVVSSLVRAVPDAAALLFVIFGTFMSLVLCANAAFGDSVYGYHTIPWAAETLGQAFIGNYDYRSLHAAQPTFSFIFFFVFQIMITMILISMFVAVFTDAFGDTVDAAVDVSQVRTIMTANARHTLERATLGGSLRSSFPIQLLKSSLRSLRAVYRGDSLDPYRYEEYFSLVEKCFDDILTPEHLIKERLGLRSDKELNGVRLLAVFHMLQLLRRIPIPPASEAVDNPGTTTSIYDFAGDMLGDFDYPLLMSYFVMVPQVLFDKPGESSIIEVLNTHKAWFDLASRASIKAGEVDQLELRVRAIVAERDGAKAGGEAKRRPCVARSGTMARATPKAVKEFVATLDYIHKRLFFGIICLGQKEEFKSSLILTKTLFATLVSRCPNYPTRDLPIADLWEQLKLDNAPPMKMKDLRDTALEVLGQQCLSVELTSEELLMFERILAHRKQTLLSRAEFSDVWYEVRNSKPSEAMLNRIFSIFPDGTVDMLRFLSNARGNLSSHSFMSFESSFAKKGRSTTSSMLWFIFYIPFFSLILYFVNIQHGDHLWMIQNFRANFPLTGSGASDVSTFMTSAVSTIWSQANSPAQPLNYANYYVGAIRFRQQRVSPAPCDRVFSDYFGDKVTRQLRFPSYISSAADQQFYTNRVNQDYNLLAKNLSCLAAWDFGQDAGAVWDPIHGTPTITSTIPEVATAFQYQSGGVMADSDPIYGTSSIYNGGGYGLVLNVSVTAEYATQAVNDLLASNWIDSMTRVVVLEFVAFNYNLEIFCRARLGYEITGIGIANPIDSHNIVGLEDATPKIVVLSILMFILIIIYCVSWSTRFRECYGVRIKTYGDPFWLAPFMTIHTSPLLAVDAGIILTFIITYAIRFGKSQSFTVNGYTNNGNYALDVAAASTLTQVMLKLMGTNVFLVFLRFLEIISMMQPHVASFILTLRAAAADLLSIISLWVFALFTFTLSGVILFGYATWESFNLQNQFFDLFNTASGGNPNYYDYTISRREGASVFYILYFVTCFFILYNMVVAVLTGQFSEVKESLFDDSVAKKIIGEEASFNVKGFIKNHVLYRELEAVWYLIKYRFDVPFGLRNRNPRQLWAQLSQQWDLIDTGEPVEVVFAAASLVALSYEAGRQHWLLMHKLSREIAGSIMAEELHVKPPTVKDHRLMHRNKVETEPVVPLRLKTISDRRLPLWEEFVFYRFGNERDCIHRYLVWLPSVLLGISQRTLWLEVLEEHHYFSMLREKYTVDLSESKLVQIYKILPETNEITITHLALAEEEKEVLNEVFPVTEDEAPSS